MALHRAVVVARLPKLPALAVLSEKTCRLPAGSVGASEGLREGEREGLLDEGAMEGALDGDLEGRVLLGALDGALDGNHVVGTGARVGLAEGVRVAAVQKQTMGCASLQFVKSATSQEAAVVFAYRCCCGSVLVFSVHPRQRTLGAAVPSDRHPDCAVSAVVTPAALSVWRSGAPPSKLSHDVATMAPVGP